MFEIFSPIWSHVNENEKNIVKNEKFEKQKKNGLEIWWIGTCPQNLALIHSMVSEKTVSTDDGRTDGRRRTTDARVTTVALLCSSTKQS